MTSEDLSPEERRQLLAVARRALAACLAGGPLPQEPAPPGTAASRGAFVTLRRRDTGELRGCIGCVEVAWSLVEAVARAAVAAALHDGRFEPVRAQELPALSITVSVLGPLRRVRAEEIEVGTHGLIVRNEGRSGLLLPQVAPEYGWDRETFLDQACRKGGLAPGAWRDPESEILAFTAIVFGEE